MPSNNEARSRIHASVRAVAIVAILLPQVAWQLHTVPLALRVLPLVLLALAVASPVNGLLVLAGLGPLTTPIAALAEGGTRGGLVLEQMLFACLTGFLIRLRPGPATRLGGPAAVLAAAALASAAAELPARVMFHAPTSSWWDAIVLLFRGEYFGRAAAFEPLYVAMITIEGVALAWMAERATRDDALLPRRVLWLVFIGHAAASAIVMNRLALAWLQSEGTDFLAWVLSLRVSPHYDKNAAGSVLAMVLLAGIGLLTGSRLRTRAGASVMLALVAAALVVTGARVALVAAIVSLFGSFVTYAALKRRRLLVPIAAGLVVAALGIAVLWSKYPEERSLEVAATGRRAMAEAALRAAREAPWFGIGVGTFFERSFEFGDESLRALVESFQASAHENAHNNFLQVLAEQGVTGLAALLLILAVGLWPALRSAGRATPLQNWLLAGIVAFVLTWLTGHPLLERESALMFWLLFGLLAALTPAAAWRVPARVALPVAALLLLTFVPRAIAERRSAMLDHIGMGLSLQWQEGTDGRRYREAGSRFSLYLQTDKVTVLPIKRAAGTSDPLRVEIHSFGRLQNAVLVAGDDWNTLLVPIRKGSETFTLVEFVVTRGDGSPEVTSPALRVGKGAIVE